MRRHESEVRCDGLSRPAVVLLRYLARLLSADGQIRWPVPDKQLVRDCAYHESSIKRGRRELVERKLIVYTPGNGRIRSRYAVTPLAFGVLDEPRREVAEPAVMPLAVGAEHTAPPGRVNGHRGQPEPPRFPAVPPMHARTGPCGSTQPPRPPAPPAGPVALIDSPPPPPSGGSPHDDDTSTRARRAFDRGYRAGGRCPRHPDTPGVNCRGCGTSARAIEQLRRTEVVHRHRAASVAVVAELYDAAHRCGHGTAHGAELVAGGRPRCALCRAGIPPDD